MGKGARLPAYVASKLRLRMSKAPASVPLPGSGAGRAAAALGGHSRGALPAVEAWRWGFGCRKSASAAWVGQLDDAFKLLR